MLMGNETHSPLGGLRRNPGKTFLGWLKSLSSKPRFFESEEGRGVLEMFYIFIWKIVARVCAYVKIHCAVLSRCTDVSYTSTTISVWLQNFDNHARITGINEFCLGPIRTYGLCSHYPFPSQTHQTGQAGVWAQNWLTFKVKIPSSCIYGSSFMINARSHTTYTHTHSH